MDRNTGLLLGAGVLAYFYFRSRKASAASALSAAQLQAAQRAALDAGAAAFDDAEAAYRAAVQSSDASIVRLGPQFPAVVKAEARNYTTPDFFGDDS